jgi:hypothetical protein
MRTSKTLVLLASLSLGFFGCRKAEEAPEKKTQIETSKSDEKSLSSRELAQIVGQARARALHTADPKKDSRKFVAKFEAEFLPEIRKKTGKSIPLFPLDLRTSANPLYSNYAALIAGREDTSTYLGDSVRGAQRREAVFLPGSQQNSECTAVLIARNAIVTASHCVGSERFLFGPTAAKGKAFDLSPAELDPLRTSDGKALDMTVLLLKEAFRELPEDGFPVFASSKMIDEAKELVLVGYGGANANSSSTGH